MTLGYFRTWWGNFQVTDNLLVTPSDYNPYCKASPMDPRSENTRFGSARTEPIQVLGARTFTSGAKLDL
jgi:hypothetical protein